MIDTYSIEMDSGSGFVEVSTSPLLSSPAVISNSDVVSGASLTFRYRAMNVHGWSDYSDEFIIVAATVPDAPTLPSSQAVEFDSKLVMSWYAPLNTGGDAIPITGYRIMVRHYDGVSFTEAPDTLCDAFDQSVIDAQSC